MPDTFNLPAIGDAMVEGEIVEWFVGPGDEVALDQVICAVETDKSVVELSTPYRGVVLELGGAPGDVLAVGAPLLIVGEAGDAVSAPAAAPPTPATTLSEPADWPVAAAPAVVSPMLRKLANQEGVSLDGLAGTGVGGRITRDDIVAAAAASAVRPSGVRVLAMPKVRKHARELGVDLASVVGTGPNGSVQLRDLEVGAVAGSPGAASTPEATSRRRLSATRRAIGRHLTESVQTIPQFTSFVDVDATALVATRAALAQRADGPVPFDALFAALMTPVLRDHPVMNAYLDGDDIVMHNQHHLGLAVDTPDGLMLPVVRDAGSLGIEELSAEIVRLAAAARGRSITPAELSGATVTLNNVGALGILSGTPILPLGTSCIVATGKTRPVVQLRNGNPVEVPTLTLSATFDHRLIDGGDSGRFLAQLKSHLEVPALGLL